MNKVLSKSLGISLIEVMFALAVVASIFVLTFARAQKSTLHNHVGMIQGSVISLVNGLEKYYYQNCQTPSDLVISNSADGTYNSISVMDLVPYGVKPETIRNTYAPPPQEKGGRNSYKMYIDQNVDHPTGSTTSLYSILEVQVEFNPDLSDDVWNTLVGLLAPDALGTISNASAKAMRWRELPVSQDVSGLSSFSAYYQLYAKDTYTSDTNYKPSDAAQPCASYELGVSAPS